ncbi:beta-ketoacyl synthase N-terminal-like domain-containing protein [Anaeromicropila populeti]|uniref:Phosphopantetheine attachment site n=1 Tax=Anaeromicropila populeti TaxID=37658 RepID=A0A1I6LFZ1_9FIRM|nr:beta-ketoacyl synthase N-terminal-like domain-containing protein [Anaeromicropila populeti]SFS02415.1 Phosphopantetheine attachment site [Anaeromicropila populeti]
MSEKAILYGKPLALPKEFHTLSEMILHISEKHPKKGLTYVNGSGQEDFITYRELVNGARRYLNVFRKKGIEAGQVMILVIDEPKEFYYTFWACVFGGIIAAPVTQPSSWEENSTGLIKLKKIWNILNKPKVVIEERQVKGYEQLKGYSDFKGFEYITTTELKSDEMAEIYKTDKDQVAFLQFSSGSTGIPKGVQLTSKNILTNNLACIESMELTEDDVAVTWLPHTHDMGLFGQHFIPMAAGSNIVVFSPFTFIRSPYLFMKKITEHKGTWFCSPNFGYDWMVKKVTEKQLETLDLSSLRITLNGAEPISTLVAKQFIEKFSKCGCKENVMFPSYGMAEATVGAAMPKVGSVMGIEKISRSKLIQNNIAVSVTEDSGYDTVEFVHEGQPIAETSIRIVDKTGKVLEENEVGEIQIKGASVTSGYYNCKELTEDTFVDGWLKTGDLGFITKGSLVVTGRIKDILFIRGQNYFAHDLEQTIYEAGMLQCGDLAFVGSFNSKLQEEELILFVKYRISQMKDFLQLRKSIKDRISGELQLEVKHVIPIKSIPKTTSGKLQRFELRKNYENGQYNELISKIDDVAHNIEGSRKSIVMPENELEEFLVAAWSEILQIPENTISVEDSFFVLGGNSVKAYQLLDKIETYKKCEYGFELLALCKTIRQISEYIEKFSKKPDTNENGKSTTAYKKDSIAAAITGIGFRFPQAKTQQEFWEHLCEQKDCVAKVSDKRKGLAGTVQWNEWIGELEDIECFDADFFEINHQEAVFMDPQQRLILETAYEALEDAGLITDDSQERNVGVFSGISANTYYQLVVKYVEQYGVEEVPAKTMVNNMSNIISAYISHQYNFTGPVMALDTACSSFMAALHYGVRGIKEGSLSGAVVASSNILTTPIVSQLARKAGIISSTSHCKVFDQEADGSVLGEGVIVVYVEPYENAVKENKNIYGIIRGTALNNDGYSLGIMAPNPKGQYEVIAAAYEDAGVHPDEIGYIEAHGTGTTIGDPIEVNALSKVFAKDKGIRSSKVGIGSVKTNLGHLLPASGGAGLIKVLLCLKNKKLVPSLHMDQVNPALQIEKSPFYIVRDVQQWQVEGQNTRKAGISSFGLGGTNTHIVVEEGGSVPANQNIQKKQELLLLSGKTEDALSRRISQMENMLKEETEINLYDLCYTSNRYRRHYGFRAACLVTAEGVQIIAKGQFLKERAAKINIFIGDIINVEEHEKQEKLLLHWYSVIKAVMKSCESVISVHGIYSGQILAEVLQNTISLSAAIEIIRQKKWSEQIELEQKLWKKTDVILSFGISEQEIYTDYYSQSKKKIQVIYVDPSVKEEKQEQLPSILGKMYAKGAGFVWKSLYPDGTGRIIHLPAYPFEKKSYWIHNKKGDIK